MNSYHFDIGDSNKGPIGLCARVRANSKVEARDILRAALPEEIACRPFLDDASGAVEYVNVYLNPDRISVLDIDDCESVK